MQLPRRSPFLRWGQLVPNRAEATTVTTPIGIQAAIDGTNLVQDIALVCQRRWRCGPYGCGWGRVCWRTAPGPYYYGGGPYYYGRPYYRRYWW